MFGSLSEQVIAMFVQSRRMDSLGQWDVGFPPSMVHGSVEAVVAVFVECFYRFREAGSMRSMYEVVICLTRLGRWYVASVLAASLFLEAMAAEVAQLVVGRAAELLERCLARCGSFLVDVVDRLAKVCYGHCFSPVEWDVLLGRLSQYELEGLSTDFLGHDVVRKVRQ